jgi:hypothetical protein
MQRAIVESYLSTAAGRGADRRPSANRHHAHDEIAAGPYLRALGSVIRSHSTA